MNLVKKTGMPVYNIRIYVLLLKSYILKSIHNFIEGKKQSNNIVLSNVLHKKEINMEKTQLDAIFKIFIKQHEFNDIFCAIDFIAYNEIYNEKINDREVEAIKEFWILFNKLDNENKCFLLTKFFNNKKCYYVQKHYGTEEVFYEQTQQLTIEKQAEYLKEKYEIYNNIKIKNFSQEEMVKQCKKAIKELDKRYYSNIEVKYYKIQELEDEKQKLYEKYKLQ